MKASGYDIHTIGRRKCSVARLYLRKEGKGSSFSINTLPYEEYFPHTLLQSTIKDPINVTGSTLSSFDIKVNVHGGGVRGQAEAVRLALSRALVELDETHKPKLKEHGLTTRDSRRVERKKYGRKKARKKFQFSKR